FNEDPDTQAKHQAILSSLANVDPAWRILLLTDDARCLALARDRFGARIIATPCQRSHVDKGVHHLPSTNRIQAGREAMIDAHLALRAQRFIGNGRSNVAAMIAVLKHWTAGSCTLLGRSILEDRGLTLYRKKADA
ncbi:MAG: hypothetical protein JF627_06330, partial [Alphaproteobacteria bacterium]|nr:hypothetical protein [Alphaproteobacteria bacterium]